MRAFFSTVDQVPVSLVVPGVEHHTIVQFEVRRLERMRSAFQVFGCRNDIANALPYAGGDHARAVQLAEADRHVKVFRDQIEEQIRDEEVDPDPRLSFEKPREEVQERRLRCSTRLRCVPKIGERFPPRATSRSKRASSLSAPLQHRPQAADPLGRGRASSDSGTE